MIEKSSKESIQNYISDASNFTGHVNKIYIPETITELKTAVERCYSKRTSITVSGARTGLAGSAVPLGGSIISTELLNKIILIDNKNKTISVQPGVLLCDVQNAVEKLDLFYPPNPTETNSSIGGNIATNASGSRTFKYGATRDYVKELKILLVNGEEVHLKRGVSLAVNNQLSIETENGSIYIVQLPDLSMPDVKHAAGYFISSAMDAIDLFIGSEGTLGIVTEITLDLIEKPQKVLGGVVYFEDYDSTMNFVEELKISSNKNNKISYQKNTELSSRLIEYFDDEALNILRKFYPQIPADAMTAIWFEQEYSDPNENIILDKWNELISRHTGLSDDTWIAMNSADHMRLRDFRHKLPLELSELLVKYKQTKKSTDAAVPDKYFTDYYQFINKSLEKVDLYHVVFGHIGNNHLHVNLFTKDDVEFKKADELYDILINEAINKKGTVSAEHGIGKIKKKYLERMYGKNTIEEMKSIKNKLDPHSLLGMGNLFD